MCSPAEPRTHTRTPRCPSQDLRGVASCPTAPLGVWNIGSSDGSLPTPSRVPADPVGDHPASRVADPTLRSDPAVGDRCAVSEHGARRHLDVGRPHPRGRWSFLTVASEVAHGGPPSCAAAPSLSPPEGGHVTRAAAPTVLADGRLAGVTRCVGCHPHLGGTAPMWVDGRPRGLPLGGSPLAGFDRRLAGTFPASASAGVSPPPAPRRSCTELPGVRSGIRSPFPTGRKHRRLPASSVSRAVQQVTGCPPVIPKLSPDPARLRARGQVQSAQPAVGAVKAVPVPAPGAGRGAQ